MTVVRSLSLSGKTLAFQARFKTFCEGVREKISIANQPQHPLPLGILDGDTFPPSPSHEMASIVLEADDFA